MLHGIKEEIYHCYEDLGECLKPNEHDNSRGRVWAGLGIHLEDANADRNRSH
jgi:hypothetical protein